jgi:hypothetical protein
VLGGVVGHFKRFGKPSGSPGTANMVRATMLLLLVIKFLLGLLRRSYGIMRVNRHAFWGTFLSNLGTRPSNVLAKALQRIACVSAIDFLVLEVGNVRKCLGQGIGRPCGLGGFQNVFALHLPLVVYWVVNPLSIHVHHWGCRGSVRCHIQDGHASHCVAAGSAGAHHET